ncbi:hypothetical protein RV06_GL000182 [Enterococcus haemoperoxidus]|nr:hypothetical protein RV06_GL000182 [Enterococcus haemoperoxidus]
MLLTFEDESAYSSDSDIEELLHVYGRKSTFIVKMRMMVL